MEIVRNYYGQLIRYLNQESRNIKPVVLISNKLKLQTGEVVLIALTLLVTLMILDVMTHTLVTLIGMAYPSYATFKVPLLGCRSLKAETRRKGKSG